VPSSQSDAVSATAWLGEAGSDDDLPVLEGDEVTVSAELSDVDEVSLLVRCEMNDDTTAEIIAVHLDRVHAIAIAGQLAAAATAEYTDLPKGHVDG
jgi:hypothetical protein